MTVREAEPPSHEASRLRQYLRWAAFPNPVYAGLLGVLAYLFQHWFLWLLAGLILVSGLCSAIAYRLAGANRAAAASLSYAAGLWLLSLGLGLAGSPVFAITVILAVLPIVIAVPYVSLAGLLRMALVATAVAAIGSSFFAIGGLVSLDPVPDAVIRWVVGGGITFLAGICSLSVWHSRVTLNAALTRLEEAYRTVQLSERSLDLKVKERTAELEHSQCELAIARDEALAADRHKSAFLANMSHELRTPLNAIIGYSEMLQEEAQGDGNASYVPDLEKILTSGRYLLTLINGVLDLAKIEAGKMDVYLESFDVAEVVRGIEGTVQPLLARNQNRLEIRGLEGAGVMHSDVTKLRQILFNLLSNATKFTRQGAVSLDVRREAGSDGEDLVFTVTDTGIGMTPEQLDKVFEAFAQAEVSTAREYGGTGLGLSITRRFCELLGGGIQAASELGRGSRFEVQLPARAPARAGAEAAGPAPPQAVEGAATVLVVDDDAAARDLIGRFLVREGYQVVPAASGEEALRLARERHPDIVTLDVLMPHMDGWAVLGQLKSDPELREIPVVLVTMTDDRNLGYTLGAAEFITKPVDWEELAAVLRRYQGAHGAGRALVVDDDPLARDMMRRALERAGWQVAEAENGRTALEQLPEARPELIVLDLMMPEMDGFEFMVALRARPEWSGVPVLVVTAKILSADDRARLAGPVARVLQKGSYTRDELLAQVRSLVGSRAGRAAAS